LISLHETDRWFGAKAAHTLARGAGAVVGPKHTWIKLLGIGLAALVVFLVFARGDWDAESDFVIEASERRSVVAPFESRLEEAFVQPNDTVARGQVLAELDTFHLERERNTLLAKLNGALQQETAARRAGKPAEAQIYASEARALRVQIEQIDEELDRAKIASPIDGIVLRGEPKRMLGKPMEKGDVLLEVGPLDALRAELSVPEDVISDLLDAKRRAEQSGEQLRGELATRGHPDRKIGFVVERVNPTAEVVENENVFKVRVRLEEIPPSLRPGTEGVAHVKLGTKPYAWLWTRKLINWVRMKLWI
jgi:multidrug efflux pump subunit AcrA (membrane-fusion protein)